MSAQIHDQFLDEDELQGQLAYRLIEAAMIEIAFNADASTHVSVFVHGQAWQPSEARQRLWHALSLLGSIPDDGYRKATGILEKVVNELDGDRCPELTAAGFAAAALAMTLNHGD